MIDKQKHKNTRRMAWIALAYGFLMPIIDHFIDFPDMYVEPLYALIGGIVLVGYIGITNVRDGWGKDKDDRPNTE